VHDGRMVLRQCSCAVPRRMLLICDISCALSFLLRKADKGTKHTLCCQRALEQSVLADPKTSNMGDVRRIYEGIKNNFGPITRKGCM